MLKLSPSDVFFSQDSISNRFGNYTRHHNKTIGETLDDIISGKCTITDLPTINVIKKRHVWVTADNRRLWVFKKLQQLGKCHTIDAIETFSIKATKCHILSSIRVRGYAGGTLWRSLESKQQNPDYRTSVSPFIFQREASLDSMSLSDQTQKWSSQLSSVSDSKYAGYRGVVRRTGYSGLATNYFKDQTTVMASKCSTSVCQMSAAGEAFKSKFKPTKTSSCKVAWSSIKVRGYEGGTLWRSLESKQQNPDYRASVSPFLFQRKASLDWMPLNDQTQKWSSQSASVSDNKYAGYRGVVRRTGYSGIATNCFKDQSTVNASKFSTSVCRKPVAREVFESKLKPTKTSSCKVAWSSIKVRGYKEELFGGR